MNLRARILISLLYCSVFYTVPGWSHSLSPSLLEITESQQGLLLVKVKQPIRQVRNQEIKPVFPGQCAQVGEVVESRASQYRLTEYAVDCGPGGLTGETLSVPQLETGSNSLVMTFRRSNGATHTTVLNGKRSRVELLAGPGSDQVFGDYFALGVEHLVSGIDHLLFIAALVMLVQKLRPLVLVVTSFTIGHAMSVVLVTLGFVSVPSLWVEIFIALSIVLLSLDVFYREQQGPNVRFTTLLCSVFGVLHGMGFATALHIADLARWNKALALVAFNLGIEAVQLLLVAIVSALLILLFRVSRLPQPYVLRPAACILGVVGALWFWERVASYVAFL